VTAYGQAALAHQLARIQKASEGIRTDTVLSAAGSIGRLVAGGEIAREHAETTLVNAARFIGLAPSDARRTVERGLEFGARNPKQAPTDGSMLRTVADARAAVASWWAAVAVDRTLSTTSMKLLAGFAALGSKIGKVRFEASYRQLSAASGLGIGTVHNHVSHVGRWVRVVRYGSHRTGACTLWQLVDARADMNKSLNPEGCTSGLFIAARSTTGAFGPGHNIWHGWPTGWPLYATLDTDEPATAANIATAIGRNAGAVRRNLGKLEALGLAARCETGWVRVEPVDDLAVYDWAAERARNHANQRTLYHLWQRDRIAQEKGEP
jgi:hypothetical protein